jgi:hypothetical protein
MVFAIAQVVALAVDLTEMTLELFANSAHGM